MVLSLKMLYLTTKTVSLMTNTIQDVFNDKNMSFAISLKGLLVKKKLEKIPRFSTCLVIFPCFEGRVGTPEICL